MNSFEDPQNVLILLRKIESSIQEDIYLWKEEMAGEFTNSYIKVREEQLETIQILQTLWQKYLNNNFN